MPANVVGLIGSLRKDSLNRKLMQACVPLFDRRLTLEVFGIDGIPL